MNLIDKCGYMQNNKDMSFGQKLYGYFLDTFQTLIVSASIFLVVYVVIARPFQVSGESMYPTFKNKEYILTNLITLKFEQLKRGDVIVFKAPNDPEKDYIKRVIGVPGDNVKVSDGKVYVNNVLFNETSYLDQNVQTYAGSFLHEGEEVTVPADSFLVMGDNRPYSSDSREWGFLPKNNIIGKSFFVYWPPSNMKLVKNTSAEENN